MTIIKPETIQKLVEGGENIARVAAGAANELTTEAINLFIVDSILFYP